VVVILRLQVRQEFIRRQNLQKVGRIIFFVASDKIVALHFQGSIVLNSIFKIAKISIERRVDDLFDHWSSLQNDSNFFKMLIASVYSFSFFNK
jgi:hypothetical protein